MPQRNRPNRPRRARRPRRGFSGRPSPQWGQQSASEFQRRQRLAGSQGRQESSFLDNFTGGATSIFETPQYEAARRLAEDQLQAALAGLLVQEQQVGPSVDVQRQRIVTDRNYGTQRVGTETADRGVFDSTIRPYLQLRDVDIPLDRKSQDIAFEAAKMLADIAARRSEAYLGYNQMLQEAGLAGADALAAMGPSAASLTELPSSMTSFMSGLGSGGGGGGGGGGRRRRRNRRRGRRGNRR